MELSVRLAGFVASSYLIVCSFSDPGLSATRCCCNPELCPDGCGGGNFGGSIAAVLIVTEGNRDSVVKKSTGITDDRFRLVTGKESKVC